MSVCGEATAAQGWQSWIYGTLRPCTHTCVRAVYCLDMCMLHLLLVCCLTRRLQRKQTQQFAGAAFSVCLYVYWSALEIEDATHSQHSPSQSISLCSRYLCAAHSCTSHSSTTAAATRGSAAVSGCCSRRAHSPHIAAVGTAADGCARNTRITSRRVRGTCCSWSRSLLLLLLLPVLLPNAEVGLIERERSLNVV